MLDHFPMPCLSQFQIFSDLKHFARQQPQQFSAFIVIISFLFTPCTHGPIGVSQSRNLKTAWLVAIVQRIPCLPFCKLQCVHLHMDFPSDDIRRCMPLPPLPGNDKADQCVFIPGCQISLHRWALVP